MPGYNIQSLFRVLPQHTVALTCAKALELPQNGFLRGNQDWVEQAISYAYSRNIPWTVLTNFRQLWLFTGDVEVRRFITLDAENYLRDFEMLWLLGRDSIERGALDEEAEKLGVQPPKIAVEERLFAQLSVWREKLFKQIHLYKPELSFTLVDETIQRLFNRLIFIRTCEDRHIEDPAIMPLLRAQRERRSGGNLARGLHRAFRNFDGYYDSDLFARHILDDLHVDDEVLSEIIEGLHKVPGGLARYDFSVIDADILGRVYEQYLGRVAQIVTSRRREMQLRLERGVTPEAAIEEVIEVVERPQRRKSQGIYYTPRWVVDYIVRETVGKFTEEHSDNPEAIHELTVLDMACGSGSFLIRAYDELLAWHAENFGRVEGDIDPHERALILRNHVFGVDLDPQAVEIARLNLLLRALAQRELLPSLADNIRVGNSLISGGAAELGPYFGDNWEEKRPFNWDQEFRQVMDQGGFDVIIGNPPYVRIQGLDRTEASYFSKRYESSTGNYDLYVLFLERGMQLLKDGGVLGFILPNNFFKAKYGRGIRRLLSSDGLVTKVVDFRDAQIFGSGTNYTALLFLKKQHNKYVLHVDGREFAEQAPVGNLGNLDSLVKSLCRSN